MADRRRAGRWGALVAAALVLALLPAGGLRPAAAAEAPPPRRVLVLSIPALTWADVAAHRPPALLALAGEGAVASMSVRTIGADTTLGEAYGTIGAGNRTATLPGAGLAADVDSELLGQEPGAVLRRRAGTDLDGAQVVHVDLPAIAARNDQLDYGAEPGMLGDVLAGAGIGLAVVGNADTAPPGSRGAEDLHREVALAAVDRAGRVPAGTVGEALLRADDTAPFGVRLDPDAMEDAVESALEGSDVAVVELSDLYRADAFRLVAAPAAALRARAAAVAATDDLLARMVSLVDLDQDLVVLVAPTAPLGPDRLTVALAAGRGFDRGLLQSGTTRRPGFVTLADVAPTVVHRLGLDVPSEMNGAPMATGKRGPVDAGTVADLVDDNEDALFRNRVANPISAILVILQVLLYGAAALVLAGRVRSIRSAVAFSALTTMALPVVAFLSGAVDGPALGVLGYGFGLFAGAAVLAGVAAAAGQRLGSDDATRAVLPPTLIAALTAVVLVGDVLVGAPLQLATPFGYGGGAVVGGRFAGYGNLAWAALSAALVLAVTGAWSVVSADRRRRHRPALLAVAVALFTTAVAAIGLPQLGLNVGGTLASLPGFAVVVLLLAGVTITWRAGLAVAVAPVLALAGFAVLDLSRAPEDRTHLGRFVDLVGEQGTDGLLTVVERKISANVSILTSSVWALMLPAAAVFVVYLTLRPPRALKALHEQIPGFRTGLVGVLVIGLLGALLNDSGVAITGMVFVIALPAVTWMAMRLVPGQQRASP